MKLRHALTIAIAVILLGTSCDVLQKNVATSGPKRYKSEIASVAEDIKGELSRDGKLSTNTRGKFDKIMVKWKGEMEKKGSYFHLGKMRDELDKMASDPANAFTHKQLAESELDQVLMILSTEVPE